MDEPTPPYAHNILNDPAASFWLKQAVRDSLQRDPIDALADAVALSVVLRRRLEHVTAER
jgi:hypothetical protein